MTPDTWSNVDAYFAEALGGNDAALTAALAASAAAGLPPINVSPCQGKLLALIAQAIEARKMLEIGTLGGYSAIWLARALPPGGKLITLEVDARHAEVARANLRQAGLAGSVDVRTGRALETLPLIAANKEGPFDFVFIDADKGNNADYFDWALKMTHPGSIIIVDNVVRNGAVTDPASTDASVRGVRRLVDRISHTPGVTATALQTVGSKGYDGFLLARVNRIAETGSV
jgi:predicted O-methyltransferase YrrM